MAKHEGQTEDKSILDQWQAETNMSTDDLLELRDSKRNELYLEQASGNEETDGPIEGGPLEDAIAISRAVNGEREVTDDIREEADEALNFFARTKPQFSQDEGTALIPEKEPKIHKGEISLMRWGFDDDPDDEFP
jgi:hypothetical protein